MPNSQPKPRENPLKTVMVSLYYPAALGAGLVWFFTALFVDFRHAWNPRMLLALWMLLFFSVSFLVLFDEETYGVLAFAIDVLETLIIFGAFFFLGMMVENQPPNLQYFYLVLTFIPILEAAWNGVQHHIHRIVWVISSAGFGVADSRLAMALVFRTLQLDRRARIIRAARMYALHRVEFLRN